MMTAPAQSEIRNRGQYFSSNNAIQQYVFDHVEHRGKRILEPSFGRGDLVKLFKDADPDYPMQGYELDGSLYPVFEISRAQHICICDFLSHADPESRTFWTIVMNPPFIKIKCGTRCHRSSATMFVSKCFNKYLRDGGEMICVLPRSFLRATHTIELLREMTANGSFTHIWFPEDEHLFDDASIDVVIFRYIRAHHGENLSGQCLLSRGFDNTGTAATSRHACYTMTDGGLEIHLVEMEPSNAIAMLPQNNFPDRIVGTSYMPGSISLSIDSAFRPVSSIFDVFVGQVSGLDSVFANPCGNMEILCDRDVTRKFICLREWVIPAPTPEVAEYQRILLTNRERLIARRIRKFNDENWFEWGALRNIKMVDRCMGLPCIFVKNLTRKHEVAFADRVQYFGGSLLCLVPKNSEIILGGIVNFLNSDAFRDRYTSAGRFKIGHRQLNAALVPSAQQELCG